MHEARRAVRYSANRVTGSLHSNKKQNCGELSNLVRIFFHMEDTFEKITLGGGGWNKPGDMASRILSRPSHTELMLSAFRIAYDASERCFFFCFDYLKREILYIHFQLNGRIGYFLARDKNGSCECCLFHCRCTAASGTSSERKMLLVTQRQVLPSFIF